MNDFDELIFLLDVYKILELFSGEQLEQFLDYLEHEQEEEKLNV